MFRYPDFRRLWIGTTASASGTWIRQFTVSVLVLDATGSASLVGLVNFLGFLPMLLLLLLGGHAVDRSSSRTVLIASQLVSGTAALILAILSSLDLAPTWLLFVMVFVIGSGYAFTKPATQALLPQIVPDDALGDVVSIHSLQFTFGMAIGPAVAGVVLRTVGPGAAFSLDALSFFILLAAAVRLPKRDHASSPSPTGSASQGIGAALRFVAKRPNLIALLLAMSASTVAIEVIKTLMPIFAVDSFGMRAENAGFLIGLFGLGSLVGAAVSPRLDASRGEVVGVYSLIALGGAVIAFSNSSVIAWVSVLLIVTGIAFMVANVAVTTGYYRSSMPVEIRGKVFAIHSLSFLGVSPLAALTSGLLADALSVSAAGTITGAFSFIGAAVLAWYTIRARPLSRPPATRSDWRPNNGQRRPRR